jgi:hypothetical protein
VQISTQALHTLTDRNVPVAFLSAAGSLVSIVDPMESVSADTRRNQVRVVDQPDKCLELARTLLAAKIRNQRTLLMRNAESLAKSIKDDLQDQALAAEKSESLASLRGHEGQAASLYFENFGQMLSGEMRDEIDLHGRQRRPPTDPVNACLSMAVRAADVDRSPLIRPPGTFSPDSGGEGRQKTCTVVDVGFSSIHSSVPVIVDTLANPSSECIVLVRNRFCHDIVAGFVNHCRQQIGVVPGVFDFRAGNVDGFRCSIALGVVGVGELAVVEDAVVWQDGGR